MSEAVEDGGQPIEWVFMRVKDVKEETERVENRKERSVQAKSQKGGLRGSSSIIFNSSVLYFSPKDVAWEKRSEIKKDSYSKMRVLEPAKWYFRTPWWFWKIIF